MVILCFELYFKKFVSHVVRESMMKTFFGQKEHSENIHTFAFGRLFILFGRSDSVKLEGCPGPVVRQSGDVIRALLHLRR